MIGGQDPNRFAWEVEDMEGRMRHFLFLALLFSPNLAHAQAEAPEPERSLFARFVEDHTLVAIAAVIILVFVVGAVAFHLGRNKSE